MGTWAPSDYLDLLLPPRMTMAKVAHRPGGHNHDQACHKGGCPLTGSEGNPYWPDSIDEAADLIGRGQHIKFDQPEQVTMLMDRLAELPKEKGKYDACRVHVPGTNVFCAGHQGIARDAMPQLKGVPVEGSRALKGFTPEPNGEVDLSGPFRVHMERQGYEVTDEMVPVAHLRATQMEGEAQKVAGMMQGMRNGVPALDPSNPANAIFITSDNYIIDGHHRAFALAALDAEDGKLGDRLMAVKRVHAPVAEVLWKADEFTQYMGLPRTGIATFNPANLPASAFALRHPPLLKSCC